MNFSTAKRLILLIVIFIFLIPFSSMGQSRPKVGLVLSGGGAKGFAHIEILKMLDSLNFPVDYVAGASMGGIIGGFYSIGYSGAEIQKIILGLNWEELFNDKPEREDIPFLVKKYDGHFQTSFELEGFTPKAPTGFIAGQKVIQTFSKYTNQVSNIDDFDDFPIPFRCVAVDLISGRPITIKNGYLALAMRSTMSIPSAFAPVKWGDYLFVDGGIMNNLPVDIAIDMGADFIIAVNIGAPKLKAEQITTAIDVLMQSFNLPGYLKEEMNIKLSDIVITPDIASFGTGDFSNEATLNILEVGKIAANAFKDSLASVMKNWGLKPGKGDKIFKSDNIDLIQNHRVTEIKTLKNSVFSKNEIIKIAQIDTSIILEKMDLNQYQKKLTDSGYFLLTDIITTKTSDSTATLYIEVVEKFNPKIQSVKIHGNKKHSFNFIYSLLGVEPGDKLDYDQLNFTINKIFGLGYFRTIYYTTEPTHDQRVILHVWVEEKEHKLLYVGFKYMQEFKLVGSLGILYNNMLLNGLRNSIQFDFAGLTRFNYVISYPSMGLDFPIYPLIRLNYRNIDEKIYTELSSAVASYSFEYFSYGIGIGFLFQNSTNIEFEIAHEEFDYNPSIAQPGFPSGNESVTMFFGRFEYDDLDDKLVPTKGAYIKGYWEGQFYTDMGEGLKYNKGEIEGDFYFPLAIKHNLHLTGYYANARGNIPLVRFHSSMTPMNFFGMDFFKIRYTRFSMLGIEYRYNFAKNAYLLALGNGGFGLQNYEFEVVNKPIIGLGAGLSYNSILGIITFKAGIAETTPYQPGQHELWSTLYIGFPL